MTKVFNTHRRFIRLGTAGLLGLSTAFTLNSCKTNTQQAETSATTTSASANGIKGHQRTESELPTSYRKVDVGSSQKWLVTQIS
ncbi:MULTISPECIES: hypothetical protein [Nostoc]|uniref:Uncharacterized protein n=2 Tax=Nostoc TaxID=1177 RepID=A0ABR8I6Z6_9NOSO|nr:MULTISPECIES: hypothetical protein [Nostoc]MBD2561516.1 hypothetical protein [Nostoc linckia FACHB-391]MBD2646654.1 hypothetical protein [Nostoc foliaceum FACHB-393]